MRRTPIKSQRWVGIPAKAIGIPTVAPQGESVKYHEISNSRLPRPMTPPTELSFLPGVPVEYVLARLRKAGGNEVGSGKLASLESSAALAVNTFGWFHERADRLPLLPMLTVSPAIVVNVEVTAHTFPLALPVQRVAQIIVAGFVWDYNGWNVASVRRFFYANIPLLEYYLYQHPKGSFRVSCHCFLQKLINVFGGNLNY